LERDYLLKEILNGPEYVALDLEIGVRNNMKRFTLALILALAVAAPARADLIVGSVTFSGAIDPVDFLTTNLLDVNSDQAIVLCAVINNCQGSYTPLTGLILANHNDVSIPFASGELWSFSFGGLDYSYDLNTIDSITRAASGIILTGTGTAHITGFEATPANWSLSANHVDQFVFSSTVAAEAIPEPTSLMLFSLGLVGAVLVRRMR
jgi:hypothetical protein